MADAATPTVDTKRFDGEYLVWRKAGQHLRKGLTQPGAEAIKRDRSRPPRFRHPDQASAEREAARLAALCPETTFVVIHEVARVKVAEVAPPSPALGAEIGTATPRRARLSPRYGEKESGHG